MEHSRKITIATRNVSHFMEIIKNEDGSYKFSGIDGRLLTAVLENLAVPYEIITPEEDVYGSKGTDGNWTGVLGLLQKDEADIAFGNLGQVYEWLEFADFSDSYHIGFKTFAMKKPQKLFKTNDFLHAFTITMWLSLFIILMLSPLVYYFFLDKKYTVANLFFQITASITKQPIDFKILYLKHRIVLGSWLMFALIISFCYTQVLLSHSTIPSETKVYKNFLELYDAVKKGDIRCYLLDSSIGDELFEKTPQTHVKELGKIITKNSWYLKRSIDAYIDLINEGQAIISGNFFPQFPYGESFNEEIFMSDDSLFSSSLSMVLNKKFCCRERLNKILGRIWNSGLMRQSMDFESFLVHLKFRKTPVQHEAAPPIEMNKIYGVFLILLAGYLLSFFTYIAEVLTFKIYSVKVNT